MSKKSIDKFGLTFRIPLEASARLSKIKNINYF